jgi:Co/Zn/Cd efflux system component
MDLPFTVVIPDFRCSIPKFSNLNLLEISLTLFFLFVLAEVCGALLSNSLSLLGDAASMSIDVMTYICNIYGEWAKSSNQRPTVRSRLILEVIIPGLSTVALLAITFYICMDAVDVLRNPPVTNDVNTNYLYGFAATNLCIDLLCGTLFYMRSDEVFVEADSLPKISLDTSVTFDQVGDAQ